ncbi:Tyrosine-protein kinase transforming protein RYK [Geodia barretti]|uniref:Tyrosine-protein kinase transforming protein RYK n=3 Tax=Geodia barretti TaxID=519541 RepID=A0AA35SKG8_GEOBA|nr:Tyrosine-protein kinase transforming protein RYK [Geodia barretti]
MSDDGLYIPESSITLRSIVGKGEFGIVYKAVLHDEKGSVEDFVAVKTLKGIFSFNDVRSLAEESQMMAKFDHPNVMKLLGVSISESRTLLIIMPFMHNGNLLSYLRNNRADLTVENENMTETIEEMAAYLLSICLQIARGMEYLASNQFVHRDLAARNCMIDLNHVIKVADFGLSEEIYARNYFRQADMQESGEGPVKLPVKWMALESLNDGVFSEKSDVWSFGVTCWEVFSLGRNPYPGVDPFSLMRYLDGGERLDKPQNTACSQEIYCIMSECWDSEPWKRPTFSELVTVISASLQDMAGYLDLTCPSVRADL